MLENGKGVSTSTFSIENAAAFTPRPRAIVSTIASEVRRWCARARLARRSSVHIEAGDQSPGETSVATLLEKACMRASARPIASRTTWLQYQRPASARPRLARNRAEFFVQITPAVSPPRLAPCEAAGEAFGKPGRAWVVVIRGHSRHCRPRTDSRPFHKPARMVRAAFRASRPGLVTV